MKRGNLKTDELFFEVFYFVKDFNHTSVYSIQENCIYTCKFLLG